MQFHAAGEGDGQSPIFEVWDSRGGLESFIREDLARAADEVSDGQADTPQPELVFDIHFQNPWLPVAQGSPPAVPGGARTRSWLSRSSSACSSPVNRLRPPGTAAILERGR
jgi:hypothetical protein